MVALRTTNMIRRDPVRGGSDGRGEGGNLREGSVRWPVLRQAIEAINYNGWMTIESNEGLSYEERSRRLDLMLAGHRGG